MAREAGEINDGDLVEDENADNEIEGHNHAFHSMISKVIFWFAFFFSCSVTLVKCVTLKFCTHEKYVTLHESV